MPIYHRFSFLPFASGSSICFSCSILGVQARLCSKGVPLVALRIQYARINMPATSKIDQIMNYPCHCAIKIWISLFACLDIFLLSFRKIIFVHTLFTGSSRRFFISVQKCPKSKNHHATNAQHIQEAIIHIELPASFSCTH